MKKAKEHTTKTLSVLLAVVMLVCAVPLTASAHSYSSDYRKWSQGGSDYSEVIEVGCWIVAISKLLYETNVDRSESFNPDRFYEWECQNGLLKNPPTNLEQTNGAEAPVIYAEQLGKDLHFLGYNWDNSDEQIMWNTTKAGYYTIVQVSENNFETSHYVMIDNELTKATGQLYCYDSFHTTGEIESQPLSRYPYRGSIYAYSAYNPIPSLEGYQTGDIIVFGIYPQSNITDEETILALNNRANNWQSYGYYVGGGSIEEGQMKPSDFMQYCDVEYKDSKYRGVKFSGHRPHVTYHSISSEYYGNGYNTGTTYWFKYESLQWKVLDPIEGLVLCVNIIDSQPYNNFIQMSGTDPRGQPAYWGDAEKTHYASDYANSSLRKWLNETFYTTAFTSSQQDLILVNQDQNNDGWYTLTGDTNYTDLDSTPTSDKVFLLSYADALKPTYGFQSSPFYAPQDTAKQAQGTDYAKCQGLQVESSGAYQGISSWWLRSPGHYSGGACSVDFYGHTYSSGGSVAWTSYGVRPACKITNRSIPEHTHTPAQAVRENVVPPTTENGGSYDEVVYCSVCFAELSRKTVNTDPLPPQEESEQTKPSVPLSPFQIIIQWFRNLFDKLFGWMKR